MQAFSKTIDLRNDEQILISCGGDTVRLQLLLVLQVLTFLRTQSAPDDWYATVYDHHWSKGLELGLLLDLDAQMTPAEQSDLRRRIEHAKRTLPKHLGDDEKKRLQDCLTAIKSILFA